MDINPINLIIVGIETQAPLHQHQCELNSAVRFRLFVKGPLPRHIINNSGAINATLIIGLSVKEMSSAWVDQDSFPVLCSAAVCHDDSLGQKCCSTLLTVSLEEANDGLYFLLPANHNRKQEMGGQFCRFVHFFHCFRAVAIILHVCAAKKHLFISVWNGSLKWLKWKEMERSSHGGFASDKRSLDNHEKKKELLDSEAVKHFSNDWRAAVKVKKSVATHSESDRVLAARSDHS